MTNVRSTFHIVPELFLVLSNDYTGCLTLLMRYPQNADVTLIIRHALYMKSPEKYQCPPNAFVYVVNSMKQRHKIKQSPSRTISHTKIFPASAIAAMAVANATDYRAKPSSPRKTSEEIRQETAKVTVQQVKRTHSHEDGIVDGYMLDDPEVLKMELQDSYNIMAVSRIKMLQYLAVLRKYIPGNQVDELHQTLDGIEELCSLLKPKHQYLFNVAAPVDPAFEADDDDTLEGGAMALKPRSFPLSVKKPNEQTEAYEVPNNRVSKNASQMLQRNRKEVEMNVIRHSAVGCLDPSQYPQNDPVGERRNSE
jgi:TBC1 domain family protein 5